MPARLRTVLLAACAVAALGGAMASPAAATSVQYSPGGAITATGPVTATSSIGTITCAVTLTGAISTAPILESAGATLGSITGGAAAACGAGAVVTLLLPWPLQFVFRLSPGNLLYDAVPAAILIAVGAIQCLYQGRMGVLIPAAGNAVTLLPMPVPLFKDLNGSGLCPANITLNGTLGLAPVQVVTEI